MAGTVVAALLPLSASAADDPIVGHDGATYPAAPLVIEGRDGDLFYGLSFDMFCTGAGAELQQGMKQLTKLTKLIRRSGRDVVFTVIPDKALVNVGNVVRPQLPHGACDKSGMKQQSAVLDTFRDPAYLPLRTGLAALAEKKQAYWRTDVHWNTIGASVYAKALGTRLDPALGARQKYERGEPQTLVGALNKLRGVDTPETVPRLVADTTVRVKAKPGTDSLTQAFPIDHAWTARPARLTYPGRTLLVGDSFTVMALELMRPMFRHGRFLWVKNVPDRTIAKAISRSDTIAIEVVQFFTAVSPLGTRAFREAVREALR